MRNSIFTLVVLLISSAVFSQTTELFKKTPGKDWKYRKALEDTLRRALADRSSIYPNPLRVDTPRNNMPVVKPLLKGKYLGNNGKGSDIYAMQPYNMPCLSPDSTYNSKMPVALKQSMIYNLNKNNNTVGKLRYSKPQDQVESKE